MYVDAYLSVGSCGYDKTGLKAKHHIQKTMSSKPPPLQTAKQEQKWTLFSSSQSLSAALNDPACREYDVFTKTWGNYFIPNAPLPLPPTDLPKIELADFQRYIKETAAVRIVRDLAAALKKALLGTNVFLVACCRVARFIGLC